MTGGAAPPVLLSGRMVKTCAFFLFGLGLLVLAGCADPAKEKFEAAGKALLDQKMETALAGYRSIPKEFPQSRCAPAALLKQGELFGAYYRNYPAALDAYESLVFNYPRATEVPEAMLRQGEIRLLHFYDHAAAAEELEAVRRSHPRFSRMDEVLFLLAKACSGASDRPRELTVLSELVEKYPESPRASEGRWMLAYALLAEGKFSEADREFRKLCYIAADRKSIARARWGMAQSLEGLGRLSEAVEQYEAIRTEWDDPSYIAEKITRLKNRMKFSREFIEGKSRG